LLENDPQALEEIARLLVEVPEYLRKDLEDVNLKMQLASVEGALSGAKQVKGRKYPMREELAVLLEILTLDETNISEKKIMEAKTAGLLEVERLELHISNVVAATEKVKSGGAEAIAEIEDVAVRFEFAAIAEEADLPMACELLAEGHQANSEWLAKIKSRLAGETLDYRNARKLLNSYVPQSFLIEKDRPPHKNSLLGTDMFSRDILLEMAYGARVSLLVGLIAGVVATIVGLLVGLFAGYMGGILDNILSTLTNLFLVIPSFVILILIAVALGQIREAWVTGLVIGLTSWPWTAKAVRAQTTSLRYRDHVNMARITGYSSGRIIVTEIIPYLASYMVMAFILQVTSGIMSEATLAILGLGDPTAISLGRMISWAQQYESIVNGRWWQFVPVACCIAMITFGLYMMNSGMDEVFNPKIRS
jgi:peptide/nickel transport system permease protein